MGFVSWWDAVASLEITRAEKAVLTVLARHADWGDGGNAWPSLATIGRDASMSERAVQHALRSLECDDDACGRPRCHHRALVRQVVPAGRYRPPTYRLLLQIPQQGKFDELAIRRRPTGTQPTPLSGETFEAYWARIVPDRPIPTDPADHSLQWARRVYAEQRERLHG